MVDPISLLGALKAVTDTAEAAGFVKAWVAGDELDRLLDHLDSRFGDTTGLSAAQLETWKDDQDFCAAVFALSYTADWETYRDDLLQAILGLTAADSRKPEEDELALARDVVGEIEFYLPYAKKDDEVTRYEGRQTRLAIERSVPLADLEWAPERGRDLFDELAEASSDEATQLQRALKGKDLRREIPGLLSATPAWLAEGSGLMWEVLAASAEGVGLWEEAVQAWDEAFDQPGSDRVRTRVRVATASYIAGDHDRADVALAEAEALDASHPLVLFTKAERSSDPEEVLALLESIEPLKDSHRALRMARRAIPLAELGRLEEADAAISQAKAEGLADNEIREIESQVILKREQPAWKAGAKTDTKALNEAAEFFLEIRDKHRELEAYEGSIAFLRHAVEALVMADERGRALTLMSVEQLSEEELASPVNRHILAELLLRVGRSDLAAAMLPEIDEEDEASILLHAIATVQGDSDKDAVDEAVVALDEALAGDMQLAAAQARAIASLQHGIEWSDEAATVVEGSDPGLAAVMRAKWLAREENWEEAERLLLPHFAEPRAQHALLEIALAREESDRIAARAREILEQPSDYAVRLEAARALISIESAGDAETELRALTSAEDAPIDVRTQAFAEIAELLSQSERYLDLLSLTEEWLKLRPDGRNPIWGRIHSLFRLGRFEEAFEFLEESEVQPATLGQSQLTARIYGLALSGEEAVRRIVEIAEAVEEPDESIEALALFAALDSPEEIPRDLAERVNPDRFVKTFPDSTLVQRFDAPETAEELVALLEELGEDRHQRVSNAARSVYDKPSAPVALIAIAAGRTVGETWRGLNRRPTGFGLSSLAADERAFASNALALGAVWDPSSLYFIEAIGGRLAEVLRTLLPKSVICQSTLDDALADSAGLRSQGERSTIGLDEQGQPYMADWTEEEVKDEAALIERVQELARSLVIEADVAAADSGAAARSIKEFDDPRPQLLTFLGTLSVAERLNLPVFSADRFVRLTARRTGIRAFGLEALIDALADRGEISTEERFSFRQRLREMGAIGTRATAEEIAADARASDFRLPSSLVHTLQDPSPLGAEEGGWHLILLNFLRTVHEEAPQTLDAWTARVLDALHRNLSLSHSQLGGRLLALSFQPSSEENPFTTALASSVIATASLFHDPGDPVLAAARLLYQATAGSLNWFTRGVLVARFANLMPPGHSFNARFVILEDDVGPERRQDR